MDDVDRIETNFRLSLISQREQSSELRGLSERVSAMSGNVSALAEAMAAVAEGLTEVSDGLTRVAEKTDLTAERLEDSLQVMKGFAEGQVEIRKTLVDYGRRLEALERQG